MSNKIEQMLRKTEELLKASRNVRANTQGLSPETAYGRLKGYHERQGKQYKISKDREIFPDLGQADPVYEGYGTFHPAHEIAHAQGMPFPQEIDPDKPSWKGKTLADWQGYINHDEDDDEGDEGEADPYRAKDEDIATHTSSLHSKRAGVGLREDVHSTAGLEPSSLYGIPASAHWNNVRDIMTPDESVLQGSTMALQQDRRRNKTLAIQKVAQLRQKLIDMNIFQMRGGQWQKQTGPNARINERQFRQEHPQEAEQLLGKPTIPQLKKK
jgi:hypothetical protein